MEDEVSNFRPCLTNEKNLMSLRRRYSNFKTQKNTESKGSIGKLKIQAQKNSVIDHKDLEGIMKFKLDHCNGDEKEDDSCQTKLFQKGEKDFFRLVVLSAIINIPHFLSIDLEQVPINRIYQEAKEIGLKFNQFNEWVESYIAKKAYKDI